MTSEPIEAEFARTPILSFEQKDESKTLHVEIFCDPISQQTTKLGTVDIPYPHTNDDLEKLRTREGYHLVAFDKGSGEDPREWSTGRKWYITCTTSILCLTVALGSSIITGDMYGPTEELGIKQVVTNLTVTCFVMGFGIGPLFLAPLSEVFGRRPIYCLSMFFYFIFTLPSALAHNSATLVVGRMLAGLSASAPMCNIGGSIADVWAIHERGLPMAVFSATAFLGPCLGPIIGGWIGQCIGWRWIYWVLFISLGFSFFLTLFIPETFVPILLYRKAEKLRKESGDDRYHTLEELEKKPFHDTLKIALVRPFLMLLQEPIVILFSAYMTFIYSLLYLLFFAFPIAFGEIRGFSLGITGTTFVSIMLGMLSAGFFHPSQERAYARATKNGTFPEARLYPMMIASFMLPAALLMFGFAGAYARVHWIVVCISGCLFGFALFSIYVSANAYIVDSYSKYAASAMAAKTLIQSEVGAMVPLFVGPMFHNMGFQWAGLLLACVALVIAPIPFIFYRYGAQVRARSGRASRLVRISDEDAEYLVEEKCFAGA